MKEKEIKVLAVSGVKNSGKTTLITKLLPYLAKKGCKAAVIKHDGHDFCPDVEGTDSYRFQQAGAYGTAVFSSRRFMVVKQQEDTQEQELLALFPEADMIILEGFKYSSYPKIELVRGVVSRTPVCVPEMVSAYVTDIEDPEWKKAEIPMFGFEEVEKLGDYLLEGML